MEISKFLTKAIFSFDKASRLGEEKHFIAFIQICNDIFHIFNEEICLNESIVIYSKYEIKSNLIVENVSPKGSYSYLIKSRVLLNGINEFAKHIYFSENNSILLDIVGKTHLRIKMNMDPIHFEVTI